MLTTTHYGLNIVEGTDTVNPLVQQNPNYNAIDAAMFANKQAVIGSGTELTAGTVHSITRANTDSNYVRFTATSNWTAGDSMVIDSTPVSVYLSDGTTPATGAYIINTEVLILVNGTRVTLLTTGKGTQDASDVDYDNSVSGIAATDVQDAIDEVHAALSKIKVSTTSKITNAAGIIEGPASTLFGGADGSIVIGAYLVRDSYSVYRSVDVKMYGGQGYQFVCYDNGVPIASNAITLKIAYIEP